MRAPDASADLLRAFDLQDRQLFRALWTARLPQAARTDPAARRLYFHVEVYFFVCGLGMEGTGSHQSARAALLEYLGSEGAGFTSDTSLLPMFALPSLPNPAAVPAFAHLFQAE